jgi:hypothetical protein
MYGLRSLLQLRGRIEEGLCLNFSHYFSFLPFLVANLPLVELLTIEWRNVFCDTLLQ